MTPVWIIGNGGHAKVAIDALRSSKDWELAGILCDDLNESPIASDVPLEGPISSKVVDRLGIRTAFIGIGNNHIRKRIADDLEGMVEWATIVHASAVISPSAVVGSGSLVCAGAIVQPSVTLEDHVILNTSSSIDHDCLVERCAHIGPGARLAGNVVVRTGGLVGIGASIIPGVSVGGWSTVGAGAVVIRDVAETTTVVGSPAKVIRYSESKG